MIGVDVRLGPAQVRWNDYVGTAAADDADAVLNTRGLYEIAGIDRDRWRIVGIDFLLGSPSDQVVVYGVDRDQHDAERVNGDSVVVTAIHLDTSVQLEQFLREAFKHVSLRLISTVVGDTPLLVSEHARLGEVRE